MITSSALLEKNECLSCTCIVLAVSDDSDLNTTNASLRESLDSPLRRSRRHKISGLAPIQKSLSPTPKKRSKKSKQRDFEPQSTLEDSSEMGKLPKVSKRGTLFCRASSDHIFFPIVFNFVVEFFMYLFYFDSHLLLIFLFIHCRWQPCLFAVIQRIFTITCSAKIVEFTP